MICGGWSSEPDTEYTIQNKVHTVYLSSVTMLLSTVNSSSLLEKEAYKIWRKDEQTILRSLKIHIEDGENWELVMSWIKWRN